MIPVVIIESINDAVSIEYLPLQEEGGCTAVDDGRDTGAFKEDRQRVDTGPKWEGTVRLQL